MSTTGCDPKKKCWARLVLEVVTLFTALIAPAQTVIPLGLYRGKQPTIVATVNGQTGVFLFDTGGGVTVVSPAVAAASGCKPWGNVTGFRMNGQRLDLPRCDNLKLTIQGTIFTIPTGVVYDIMALAGKDAPHLDGSVGLDIFAGKMITMDLSRGQLIVENQASFASRIRRAVQIPVRLVRDAEGLALEVDVGVDTPSGMAWMEMDSGNDSECLIVADYLAPLLDIDPAANAPQVTTLTIPPGVELKGKPCVSKNLIMDGNIGVEFLRGWILALDLKNGRAWVKPVAVAK